MLDGVTPFPAEFAARYRERGYWEDRPLFEGFTGALAKYADRVAVADEAGPVTYRELSERSAHLARVLLDLGFGPLERIVVQLPNTAMFAYLYFALQRIGAAPVLALPGHRKREITQFAEISGARALAVPAAARGFDFTAMAAEVMASNPALGLCFVQGADGPLPDPRFVRLEELLEREPRGSAQALAEISIDPAAGRLRADPAAPGDAHPPGARAADPVDRRPGHHRVRPVLPAGDPERRAAAPAGGQAARGARPARLLHPGELRHGGGPDHVRSVLRSC